MFMRRISRALVLGTAAAMLMTSVAFADNLQADLNTTTGGLDKNVSRGTLQASTTYTQNVFLFVQETSASGDNPTYPFSVTGSGNLGATFSGVSIAGPGTANGQTGTVSWTTPAATASAQTYTITVSFDASTDINESPATVTIEFSIAARPSDTTPPSITPNIVGTLGDNGWYTSNVTVSWTVTDPDSAVSSTSGCGTTVISTDTTGTTLTCQATSAGGTDSESVTIKRDATAPTGVATTLARGADHNGWYNASVGWSTTGTDATSGIDSCSSGTYSGPDGTGLTVSGTCTDEAGNTSGAATSAVFDFDDTNPTLAPSVSPNPVLLNGSATATPNASDATSGVATSSCGAVVTSSVGTGKTVGCQATDHAGNSATSNASYSVVYATGTTCLGAPGHQILQPINANYDTDLSVFKQGSTVPAKFRVCDANGVSIGSAGVVSTFRLTAKYTLSSAETVDEPVIATTPDTAFRWSADDQQWIYNISTKSMVKNVTYAYTIWLNDGSTIEFRFGLK
jgi:hypothetical protein